MNIATVSHLFPRPQNKTKGVFVLEQAKALSDRGHNISIISPVPFIPKTVSRFLDRTPSEEIPKTDKYGDIDVYYPRYASLPRPETRSFTAYSFRKSLRNHIGFEGADLISAHVALPDGFGSILMSEKLDIPLITTIHGNDLQQLIHKPISGRLVKNTIRYSNAVVLNSYKLQRLYKNYINVDTPIKVIHNGVTTNKAIKSEPDEREDSLFTVICVGNLKKTKGHKYLFEALARVNADIKCIVVGDGPYRKPLEEYTKEIGVNDRVRFKGEVPHEEVFSYLKSSDLFILPSYVEAFGVAYIEAMSCGLPVIACEGEGPQDYITHRETGFLVPPQDTQAIADLIQELHEDEALREYISDRAQRTALYGFSWEQNAKVVEEYFSDFT